MPGRRGKWRLTHGQPPLSLTSGAVASTRRSRPRARRHGKASTTFTPMSCSGLATCNRLTLDGVESMRRQDPGVRTRLRMAPCLAWIQSMRDTFASMTCVSSPLPIRLLEARVPTKTRDCPPSRTMSWRSCPLTVLEHLRKPRHERPSGATSGIQNVSTASERISFPRSNGIQNDRIGNNRHDGR